MRTEFNVWISFHKEKKYMHTHTRETTEKLILYHISIGYNMHF